LELVVFYHVFKDGCALPVGGFEFAVFGHCLVIWIFPFASFNWASIFFWHSGQMLFVSLTGALQVLLQRLKLWAEESSTL
jgi:hypothetical protein